MTSLLSELELLPRTKAEAIACNSQWYYTGKPCVHGHTDRRNAISNGCRICINAASARYKDKYQGSLEKGHRISHILRRYKMSKEKYAELLVSQDNKCSICRTPFDFNKKMAGPYVDHNHKTGEHRELLCRQCNLGIGFFKDKPALLLEAAQYINRHSNQEAQ